MGLVLRFGFKYSLDKFDVIFAILRKVRSSEALGKPIHYYFIVKGYLQIDFYLQVANDVFILIGFILERNKMTQVI